MARRGFNGYLWVVLESLEEGHANPSPPLAVMPGWKSTVGHSRVPRHPRLRKTIACPPALDVLVNFNPTFSHVQFKRPPFLTSLAQVNCKGRKGITTSPPSLRVG